MERVFINFQNETKKTKQIKPGDMITIRGKGRFFVKELRISILFFSSCFNSFDRIEDTISSEDI